MGMGCGVLCYCGADVHMNPLLIDIHSSNAAYTAIASS